MGVFFVARLMGAEVWGMVGFAVGIGALLFHTDLGFGVAHQKRISEGKDIGECLGAYARFKFVLTSILVAALLLGYYIWDSVLGYGYDNPMIIPVVFIILGYYIMFAVSQLAGHTFGGLRQSVKQHIPEMTGTAKGDYELWQEIEEGNYNEFAKAVKEAVMGGCGVLGLLQTIADEFSGIYKIDYKIEEFKRG